MQDVNISRDRIEFTGFALSAISCGEFSGFLNIELVGLRETLLGHLFGCLFCHTQFVFNVVPRGGEMGILILKVLAMWSLVAMVAGLSLGAAIRKGERIRKDEFLSCVFASLETLQASRG